MPTRKKTMKTGDGLLPLVVSPSVIPSVVVGRRKASVHLSPEQVNAGGYQGFPSKIVPDVDGFLNKYRMPKTFDFKPKVEARKLLKSAGFLPSLFAFPSHTEESVCELIRFHYVINENKGQQNITGTVLQRMASDLLYASFEAQEPRNLHGLDAIVRTSKQCYNIEMKSSRQWGNTSSHAGTSAKLHQATREAQSMGYANDSIVNCVLNLSLFETNPSTEWEPYGYLQLNGRDSWAFITGDFYFSEYLRQFNVYSFGKRPELSATQETDIYKELLNQGALLTNTNGTLIPNYRIEG